MKATDNRLCLALLAESSTKPPPEATYRIQLELLRLEIEQVAARPMILIMLRHVIQAELGGYFRAALYFAKEGLGQKWLTLRYRLEKCLPGSRREERAAREFEKLLADRGGDNG